RISTALTIGDTFSSCLVSIPMDTPATLIPSRSLRGIGTIRETTPRISVTSPIQNKVFMLVRRILLSSGFDTRQNPHAQQYERADRDPVRGHMHQSGAVHQATNYDQESKYIKSE